jgi:aspartyl protease family protein
MKDFPHTLKFVTVWLLLGTALFLGVQAWQAQQARSRFSSRGGVIELQRAPDGHFHWPGRVNGVAVVFMIDTGATRTALPAALGAQAGLRPEGSIQSDTAGGQVQGQLARADVQLDGGVRIDPLRVALLPGLTTPLLGMDVLSRVRFSQLGGVLRLEPASSPP